MSNSKFIPLEDIVELGPISGPAPDPTEDILWCVSKVCGFIGESFLAVSKAADKY